MKYLSTNEIAKKWGISQRRVSLLCFQGRIYGALKTGKTWLIPEYAMKPADERIVNEITNEEVSEPSILYGSELKLDPLLVKQASIFFSKKGESLSDVINQFLYDSITKNKKRIGIAYGLFKAPNNLDFCNDEISALFDGAEK